MAQVQQVPQMAVEACSRLVDDVATRCAAMPAPSSPPPASPNFDALGAALAAQGNAISQQANLLTAIALLVSLGALVGGIAWAFYVKKAAERMADQAASSWMDENAAGIIAKLDAEFRAKNATVADAEAKDLAEHGDGE